MSDINIINVSTLKSFEKQFLNEYNKFINKTYATFSASYLNNCSDSCVKKMARELKEIYSSINKSYKNIDKWWKEYNINAEGIENSIVSGSITGITESIIRSDLNKLPELEKLKVDIGNSFKIGANSSTSLSSANGNVSSSSTFSSAVIDIPYLSTEIVTDNLGAVLLSNNSGSLLERNLQWWEEEKKSWSNFFNNIAAFFSENAEGIMKRTGATVATGAISVLEGFSNFGEALVDFVGIVGGGVTSIFTGIYDAYQAVNAKITGKEWNSLTKRLWKDFIDTAAVEVTSSWFNKLYETDSGKWLKDNSYGFETTRELGKGVGYIGGIIALSIFTCGVGSAVGITPAASTTLATASLGSASVSITAGTVSSTAIATAAGIGKNTTSAWSDGASVGEGLLYGSAMGLWEGGEMFLGHAINSLDLGLGTGIKKQVINSLSHVLFDTADGGSAAFIDPLMQMIYNPTEQNKYDILKLINYDENGNRINNKNWEDLSFKEKYTTLFNYNGGWSNVLQKAGSAAIFSAGSEIPDVLGSVKMFEFGKKLSANITDNDISAIKQLKGKDLDNFVDLATDGLISSSTIKYLDSKQLNEIVDKMSVKELEEFLYSNKKYFVDDISWSESNAKKIYEANRYSVLNDFKDKKSDKFFLNSAKICDGNGYISKEDANILKNMFFEEDSIMAVHRTNMHAAEGIAREGLWLTGHGANVTSATTDLGLNMSFYPKTEQGFANFISDLKRAGGYNKYGISGKDGAAVILKIPTLDLILNDDITSIKFFDNMKIKNIDDFTYIAKDNTTRIMDKKYICGIVSSNNGVVSDLKIDAELDVLKNTTKAAALIKEYFEFSDDLQNAGVSLQKYLDGYGIKTVNLNNRIEAAEYLGDSKLYLYESLLQLRFSGSITDQNLKNELNTYIASLQNTTVGNLDVIDMLNNSVKFLDQDTLKKAADIANTGITDKFVYNLSDAQKKAVYNYTKCGGFEICGWFNDTTGPYGRYRDIFKNPDDIQNRVSGMNGNKIFTADEGSIVECLDTLIASSSYDDAIMTYRGVKGLYCNGQQIDINSLKVGSTLDSAGYQSSSVFLENSYARHNDVDYVLEILIPPESKSAAYIENISGIRGYNQMEVLIKRDATLTVIGDVYDKMVRGVPKKVIPVVLN